MVFDYFKKKKKPRGTEKPSAVHGEPAAVIPRPPTETAPAAEPVRKPVKAAAPAVSRDEIAQRAYEIWVRKGQPAGSADQDWLEAEAELRAGAARPRARPNQAAVSRPSWSGSPP